MEFLKKCSWFVIMCPWSCIPSGLRLKAVTVVLMAVISKQFTDAAVTLGSSVADTIAWNSLGSDGNTRNPLFSLSKIEILKIFWDYLFTSVLIFLGLNLLGFSFNLKYLRSQRGLRLGLWKVRVMTFFLMGADQGLVFGEMWGCQCGLIHNTTRSFTVGLKYITHAVMFQFVLGMDYFCFISNTQKNVEQIPKVSDLEANPGGIKSTKDEPALQ